MKLLPLLVILLAACTGAAKPAPVAVVRTTPTVPLARLLDAQSTAIADATAIAGTQSAIALGGAVQSENATHIARVNAAQLHAIAMQSTAQAEVATASASILSATLAAIPTSAHATAVAMVATQQALEQARTLDAQRHAQQLEAEAAVHTLGIVASTTMYMVLTCSAVILLGWGAGYVGGRWVKAQAEAQAIQLQAEAQARVHDAQAQYLVDLREHRAIAGQVVPVENVGGSVLEFVRACIVADTALNGQGTRIPPARKMGSYWAGGHWQRAVDELARQGLIAKTGDNPNSGYQVRNGNLSQLLIDVGG